MYDGHWALFCVDVYAEVFLYVEFYEDIRVYKGHEAGFCVYVYSYVQ